MSLTRRRLFQRIAVREPSPNGEWIARVAVKQP